MVNPGAAQEPSATLARSPARAGSEASLAGEYEGCTKAIRAAFGGEPW